MTVDKYGFELTVGDYVYSIPTGRYDDLEVCRVIDIVSDEKIKITHLEYSTADSRKNSKNVVKVVGLDMFKKWLVKKELKNG